MRYSNFPTATVSDARPSSANPTSVGNERDGSSRRDKRHKRCQSPQPLGQAPEPRPDVGGAREAITPALHVVGGGELNQRPLPQQAAKRCAILLCNSPAVGRISRAASHLVSAFCERSMSASPSGATMTGGAHAKA
jgi:hypothetical protein